MTSRNVLVTGGNKGIGLAVTQRFLDYGDKVFVVARDFKDFSLKDHPNLEMVEFDLSNIDDIPKLVSDLPEIDVLVNNAGIMHAVSYDEYTKEKQDSIFKINLEAPVKLITEISKSMVSKGKGRIVNNASIAGQIGHPDIWYGITKAGMINLTKSFAKILGPKGIVVNAVAPGPVETDMLATIPEQRKRDVKGSVYSNRFAYPEEVADSIFWLGNSCPEYINGTCIDINNGAFPR